MEHNCAHPLVFYQDLLRKAASDLRVAEDARGRLGSGERVCEGESSVRLLMVEMAVDLLSGAPQAASHPITAALLPHDAQDGRILEERG
ncbi:hypothetical protein E2C01_038025 [Portunus trituberculatus]|uniref:Uncharacterized protein n=1 Tax=Portunus trituberculatus TaxID=210409 RepID=A0A5B7FD26_PORTR|nr:hypothetical protein [Portunus trituberculatus]